VVRPVPAAATTAQYVVHEPPTPGSSLALLVWSRMQT
jgi:hypothetical protein